MGLQFIAKKKGRTLFPERHHSERQQISSVSMRNVQSEEHLSAMCFLQTGVNPSNWSRPTAIKIAPHLRVTYQ